MRCKPTQGFGQNANPTYKGDGLLGHTGIDYQCGYQTTVVSEWNKEYVYKIFTPAKPASDGFSGIFTIVEQENEVFEFLYGHVGHISVKEGQTVTRGKKIATEGNYGRVWQGGRQCTAGQKLSGCGSHRHYQKRAIKLVESTDPNKIYLQHPTKGLYLYKNKYYCEIKDYWNGFNGCVPFELPSQMIEETIDVIDDLVDTVDTVKDPMVKRSFWELIESLLDRIVSLSTYVGNVGGVLSNNGKMNSMENKLISVRVKSFAYSLLSLGATAVLGFIASPDFASLVTEHFGNTAIVSLVLLVVPEVVKHLRNLSALKNVGGEGEVELI